MANRQYVHNSQAVRADIEAARSFALANKYLLDGEPEMSLISVMEAYHHQEAAELHRMATLKQPPFHKGEL
jgi:hypothetical protein